MRKKWIVEPPRRTPVVGAYDVVVVGGGIAGVASAVCARRAGAGVTLIEKECALGGLATLANLAVFLPLCDGMGRQVACGVAEELLRLSIRDHPDRICSPWRKPSTPEERADERFRVQFNPASFLLALEELAINEGVDIFYDARSSALRKKEERIEAVVIENKDGRSALLARAVVDATGDADVCARACEPTVCLPANVPAGWYYYSDDEGIKLRKLSKPYEPLALNVPDGERGYAGDRAEEVTQDIIESHKLVRDDLASLRSAEPLRIPLLPSLRMTRRLKGGIELDESDAGRYFADCIGMIGDWREPSSVYEIPFRVLQAVRTANLVVAGRCVSASGAWDVLRSIPACAVTGQCAGVASALVVREQLTSFCALNIKPLQRELLKQHAVLPT